MAPRTRAHASRAVPPGGPPGAQEGRRGEVLNYTVVVLVATAFLIAITFAFDYIFGELFIRLYGS